MELTELTAIINNTPIVVKQTDTYISVTYYGKKQQETIIELSTALRQLGLICTDSQNVLTISSENMSQNVVDAITEYIKSELEKGGYSCEIRSHKSPKQSNPYTVKEQSANGL